MFLSYDKLSIVFYNCMKFRCSCNDFQLTEWTRNSIGNDQRAITPKICIAVMVLVHDTWFHCALQ